MQIPIPFLANELFALALDPAGEWKTFSRRLRQELMYVDVFIILTIVIVIIILTIVIAIILTIVIVIIIITLTIIIPTIVIIIGRVASPSPGLERQDYHQAARIFLFPLPDLISRHRSPHGQEGVLANRRCERTARTCLHENLGIVSKIGC